MSAVRLTTDFIDSRFTGLVSSYGKSGETILFIKKRKISILRLIARHICQYQEFECVVTADIKVALQEIEALIQLHPIDYPLTKAIFYPKYFTLIPDFPQGSPLVDLFIDASLVKKTDNYHHCRQSLPSMMGDFHFYIDEEITTAVTGLGSESLLVGYAYLIEFWNSVHSESLEKKLFVQVEEDSFYAAYFHEKKLILFNQYEFSAAADFLYFVLFIFKELGLQASEEAIFLSGRITNNSDLFSTLAIYIKDLRFLEIPSDRFGDFNPEPHHLYTDLFASIACVS